MPELPEAETIARDLSARIVGHRIRRVRVHREEVVEPMTPRAFSRRLTGRTVERVDRRAKWIFALLDDGRRWLTQLRMTGRFTWSPPAPLRRESHLSVSVLFDGSNGQGGEGGEGGEGGGVVRFYDVRRFGRMYVLDAVEWGKLDARLGPEPLSDQFTSQTLARVLEASKAPLRNVLIDQRRIAGVGNIYANEACFLARLDPRRPAATIRDAEVQRLHEAIQEVLRTALRQRGTSFSNYRDVAGAEGEFQNQLAVYGRTGEGCPVCDSRIARAVLAGRSAFFCPNCQI